MPLLFFTVTFGVFVFPVYVYDVVFNFTDDIFSIFDILDAPQLEHFLVIEPVFEVVAFFVLTCL